MCFICMPLNPTALFKDLLKSITCSGSSFGKKEEQTWEVQVQGCWRNFFNLIKSKEAILAEQQREQCRHGAAAETLYICLLCAIEGLMEHWAFTGLSLTVLLIYLQWESLQGLWSNHTALKRHNSGTELKAAQNIFSKPTLGVLSADGPHVLREQVARWETELFLCKMSLLRVWPWQTASSGSSDLAPV